MECAVQRQMCRNRSVALELAQNLMFLRINRTLTACMCTCASALTFDP